MIKLKNILLETKDLDSKIIDSGIFIDKLDGKINNTKITTKNISINNKMCSKINSNINNLTNKTHNI